MNRCQFCNKIYDIQKLEQICLKEEDVFNCIMHNKKNDTYCIYHKYGDNYNSNEILEINFCPKCGRRL